MPVDSIVLAAIASPRRRAILQLLWDGELPAGAVNAAMPDITFGAVSLQLGALTRAGLLRVRRAGQRRLYSVDRQVLGPVAEMLEQTWADALWRLTLQAELDASRRGPQPAKRQIAAGRTGSIGTRSAPSPKKEKPRS